jgi:hypothetical protein
MMSPDPAGERIARLEASATAMDRNIERIESKVDEALHKLSGIEMSMNRHRGVEGIVLWIANAVRMIVAGLVGAGASIWFGRN